MNDKIYNITSLDEVKVDTSSEYTTSNSSAEAISIIELDNTLPKDTIADVKDDTEAQFYESVEYLSPQKVKAKRYVLRK